MENGWVLCDLMFLELVKVGFHGAAIAMAILTYKLIKKVIVIWKPDEVKPQAVEILSKLLKTIRVFMVVCISLFIVGVLAQILAQRTKPPIANIQVAPSSWPKSIQNMAQLITVKHGQDPVELVDGLASVNIADRDTIRFIMDELVYEINDLDISYKTLLTQRSPGGGFGK